MITFQMNSTVQGELLGSSKTKITLLIDSGTTRTLLNQHYYYKNPFLRIHPKYKLVNPAIIRTLDITAPFFMVH